MVQLIYAGANQTNNPAIPSGSGVTGDDQIAAKGFLGQNDFEAIDGVLPFRDLTMNLVTGGWYFVRTWSAPSFDYAAGVVPISFTNRYIDSSLWLYPGGPIIPDNKHRFNFGGEGLATTLIPGADSDGDGIPDWWEFMYFNGITNAVAGWDEDGDAQHNYNEFRAGTDPTNPLSLFQIEASVMVGESMVLEWSSVSGRTYAVSVSTNLLESFEPVWTNLPSAPPVNSWTASWPGVERAFFAVEVE